jgi:hypothetical protein
MSEGVAQVAALGGRTVRIVMSPRHYSDYGDGQCNTSLTLTAVAQQTDVRKALDTPQIDVYVITAYDSVTFGDCTHQLYLRPDFYTADNTAALIREYSDFTLFLYHSYSGTRKKFIITNWESDNTVYCGDAHGYATDAGVRTACNARYRTLYGNSSPDETLAGLRKWFEARQLGITEGRARAAALGLGGSRVYFAPEICSVHALHDAGFKSVLYEVLPHVMFDYVSYSSWDSINTANPEETLIADLNTIEEVTGTDAIIIGEMGYSRTVWGDGGAVARIQNAMDAAFEWGVAYVIEWSLYDQAGGKYGLFDQKGLITALGASFRDDSEDSCKRVCSAAVQ